MEVIGQRSERMTMKSEYQRQVVNASSILVTHSLQQSWSRGLSPPVW